MRYCPPSSQRAFRASFCSRESSDWSCVAAPVLVLVTVTTPRRLQLSPKSKLCSNSSSSSPSTSFKTLKSETFLNKYLMNVYLYISLFPSNISFHLFVPINLYRLRDSRELTWSARLTEQRETTISRNTLMLSKARKSVIKLRNQVSCDDVFLINVTINMTW